MTAYVEHVSFNNQMSCKHLSALVNMIILTSMGEALMYSLVNFPKGVRAIRFPSSIKTIKKLVIYNTVCNTKSP